MPPDNIHQVISDENMRKMLTDRAGQGCRFVNHTLDDNFDCKITLAPHENPRGPKERKSRENESSHLCFKEAREEAEI